MATQKSQPTESSKQPSVGFPLTKGATKLIDLAIAKHGSIGEWCTNEGKSLNKQEVMRAVSGLTQRIPVDLAFDIEDLTDGRIKASWWHSKTKAAT